ncbi:MAG: hypothetical protein ACHQRJ_16860 [Alphaproteobacteria bacterium]
MWTKDQYKAYKAKAYRRCEEWFEGPWWFQEENKIAKFTGWLVVYTCGLAVIAFLQWCVLNKTDETLQNQQRSYMYVAPAGAFNVNADGVLQGYVVVGNSGQSIAKRVKRYASVQIATPPGPADIADISKMTAEEGSPTFAPPVKQAIYRELPERGKISSQDFAAVQSGAKRIYVFGTIFYDDVFDNPHKTEFCHMYFGTEMADDNRNAYAPVQAKYCDRHNDAD